MWGSAEEGPPEGAFGYLEVAFNEIVSGSSAAGRHGLFDIAHIRDTTILTNIHSWGGDRDTINQGLLKALSDVHSQIENPRARST